MRTLEKRGAAPFASWRLSPLPYWKGAALAKKKKPAEERLFELLQPPPNFPDALRGEFEQVCYHLNLIADAHDCERPNPFRVGAHMMEFPDVKHGEAAYDLYIWLVGSKEGVLRDVSEVDLYYLNTLRRWQREGRLRSEPKQRQAASRELYFLRRDFRAGIAKDEDIEAVLATLRNQGLLTDTQVDERRDWVKRDD